MSRKILLALLLAFTVVSLVATTGFILFQNQEKIIKKIKATISILKLAKKQVSKQADRFTITPYEVIDGERPAKPTRTPLPEAHSHKYPCDNGVPFDEDTRIYRHEVDHGKWKQVYVSLPPFHWETPHLLTTESANWFWKQPENMRHFEDTINPYSGCVQVIQNGNFDGRFAGKLNQTHYTNIVNEPNFTNNPEFDIAFFLTSHQTEYFQHFIDNGLPHIELMLLATGYKPSDVTMVLSEWNTNTIPDILKRIGFKVERRNQVSAKILVLPEVVPVIHQRFYQMFASQMNISYKDEGKIVLVSRKSSDTHKNTRLINNQDELFKKMQETFGDKAVLYVPRQNSFESSIAMFQGAKVVLGSHGGAMYNSLFSSPATKIIEIMPVKSNGLYPGQGGSQSIPPFAHLAMYTNAQLMRQPFYRYYHVSGNSANMNIDIEKLINFINSVIEDNP